MNVVVLVGRLVRDPEIRYISDNQRAVTTFTLAVDRPFSKDGGADFLRIVVYGKSAENCATYLAKGSQVGVQGRIQTGSYETKTGEKRYTTDIIADRVEFLQRAGQGSADARPPRQDFQQYERQGGSAGMSGGPMGGIPDGFHAFDDEDDDNIPF